MSGHLRARIRSSLLWPSLVASSLLCGCGGPELACPSPALPSATPGYAATLTGLVVVPTRAELRAASARERETFEDFAARLQEACAPSPPRSECALASARARLVALPAPDHPALFTSVDGALDAALAYAHDEVAVPDRDCEGLSESACDARAITRAFARAACELRGGGGHP
ncbi:MAG: hypothetical protein KF729_14840 [Sandaracinaceae bacterium]|nr:hypothetical protein [Sandaracinaceae bacterium]